MDLPKTKSKNHFIVETLKSEPKQNFQLSHLFKAAVEVLAIASKELLQPSNRKTTQMRNG